MRDEGQRSKERWRARHALTFWMVQQGVAGEWIVGFSQVGGI